MKIVIDEAEHFEDVEVIIKCKKCDEEILDLIARLKMQREKIIGTLGDKTFVIDPKEILYFDSVDKKTFVYTKSEVYETALRLYEVEKTLKLQGFFRAAKSTVMNIAKIISIKSEFNSTLTAQMENGEKLTVSRQYAPILKERLMR